MPLRRETWTRMLDGPFPRDVRRIELPGRCRVLITQLDKLGDVLCSTAAIAHLSRALPDARITVACQPYSRVVLANNPRVDEILTISAPWSSTRFAGSMSQRAEAVRSLGRLLRERRFHIGIDLQGNPLNAVLLWLARIPIRVGMTGLGGNVFLTAGQRMDWFANRVAFRLRLVERLTGMRGRPVTRFDVTDEDRTWARHRLREIGEVPAVILCPTAENPLRMWEEGRYIELGRRLSDRANVLFCHAPEDAERAARFAAQWRDRQRCHVIETTSFGRLAGVQAEAAVVVSGDSAPMHLAVAVGTPVVALFGPSPPSAAGPIDWDFNRVLEPAVLCKACLWGPHAPACPTKHCLGSITVDRVERAVRELLDRDTGA